MKTSKMQQKTKESVLTQDVIGYIEVDEVRFEALAIDSYMRLARFKTGDAVHADRQTTMIRLYGGLHRLEDFEAPGAEELLLLALKIVTAYRPQVKKELRKFSPQNAMIVGEALGLVKELFAQSSVWECVQAYKHGEDMCLTGSDETEYVLMTIH